MKKGKKNNRVNLFERSFEEVRDTLKIFSKRELQYELDHFQDREWQSEQQKLTKTPILHLNDTSHKMPSTRREFLAQGLIGTTLSVTLPTMLTAQRANALICPDPGAAGAGRLPILVIDGSGGPSWAGDNVMVGSGYDAGANTLAYLGAGQYARFGVGSAQEPSAVGTIKPFGAQSRMEFHPLSQMAAGITQTITATAAANTDGVVVAAFSDDDTGNNNLNISQALVQAGFAGELAGAIGNRNSPSGGRSRSIMPDAATNSTQVADQTQAAGLVNPGDLATGLGNNNASVEAVLRKIASLTEAQTNAIKSGSLAAADKTAVACGANANIANLGGKDLSNIYGTTIVQAAFNNPTDDTDQAIATGVYLALTGQVGIATVEVGGCDYHGQGRNAQNAKDLEVGRAIGNAITMAEAANSPLMIYLLSDGSTSSNTSPDGNGMHAAQSDNGNYASLVMIVYKPDGRVAVTQPQLGSFTANGVLQDGSFAFSSSQDAAARVIALNYMFLAGKIANVGVLGTLPGTIDELKAFGAPIIT